MKFCPNCGTGLADNAYACTTCGFPVAPQPQTFTTPAQPQNIPMATPNQQPVENKEPTVLAVFNFISTLFLALTAFFLFTSVFYSYIDSDINYSSYSNYTWVYSNMVLDYGSAVVAILAGFGAFGTGLATFILSLSNRQKGSLLFRGICKLVFGLMAVILAFMAMSFT